MCACRCVHTASWMCLLPALRGRRQGEPADAHAGKQSQSNRVQNPSPRSLGEQTRGKRGNSTAAAPKGRDDDHASATVGPGHAAHKDGGGAGVNRPQQQTDNREGNGTSNNVGNPPDEELEAGGAGGNDVDEAALANALGRIGEGEAADGDAGPEAGGDVANGLGVADVARGDEEGDDPA
jgi:hypothetical protein